jgi:ABC-2 type transport system ATP-binding protein
VLLLDEPTSALDPLAAGAVHHYIAERRAAGDAIILSTHQLPEAEALSDRIAIMASGHLLRQGSGTALRSPVAGQECFIVTLAGPRQLELLANLRQVPGVCDLHLLDGLPARPQLTYRTTTPERTNAAVLAALIDRGAAVVALESQLRSLGAVYLETLKEAIGVPDDDHLPA